MINGRQKDKVRLYEPVSHVSYFSLTIVVFWKICDHFIFFFCYLNETILRRMTSNCSCQMYVVE